MGYPVTAAMHPSPVLAVADHLAGEAHRASRFADALDGAMGAPGLDVRALADEAARYRVAAEVLLDEAMALVDAWEAGR